MLTALSHKLGLIRPCETVEIFPTEAEEGGTFGGPSLVFTAKGVEGPLWSDDSMWDAEAPRPCGDAERAPLEDAAAPDKPQEDEDQTGAA